MWSVTWYQRVSSSGSGFLKKPPTSAPDKVMPTKLSERSIGIVMRRWSQSPVLSPVQTAPGKEHSSAAETDTIRDDTKLVGSSQLQSVGTVNWLFYGTSMAKVISTNTRCRLFQIIPSTHGDELTAEKRKVKSLVNTIQRDTENTSSCVYVPQPDWRET